MLVTPPGQKLMSIIPKAIAGGGDIISTIIKATIGTKITGGVLKSMLAIEVNKKSMLSSLIL